jgi:hypothetical protein
MSPSTDASSRLLVVARLPGSHDAALAAQAGHSFGERRGICRRVFQARYAGTAPGRPLSMTQLLSVVAVPDIL